jgi:tRNA threonylcarbamoyladenosine biosynthesis protein TsaE
MSIDPKPPEPQDLPPSSLELWLPTAAATTRLGVRLGRLLGPGDLLGLDGPLGAGKTALVAGIARGAGALDAVASPTFTLINSYRLAPSRRQPAGMSLYHLDLYRLVDASELDELGLWELAESGGVLAVEWLSRFPAALPGDRLDVTLSLGPGRGRTIRIAAGGRRAAVRLDELRQSLATKR